MLTLSYGIKKPQTGDNGSVYYPAMEGNFQQQNDHSHNGVDSALLPASSIAVVTQSVSHTTWSATSGGTYRQQVTMPVGLLYDSLTISTRNASTGDYLTLTIQKIDATNFYVYINDNTVDLTVVYGL